MTHESLDTRHAIPDTHHALVNVVWSSRGHYWAVTIERCPLCGKRHYHGGGDGLEPALGHRVAHCLEHAGSYDLVETAASLVARQHTPGPRQPHGCLGEHCAVGIGHQVHRCSGCKWKAA